MWINIKIYHTTLKKNIETIKLTSWQGEKEHEGHRQNEKGKKQIVKWGKEDKYGDMKRKVGWLEREDSNARKNTPS